VEEIEQAAEQLDPSDFDRLALWVSARYHDLWGSSRFLMGKERD